jgi:hypothetical protein
VEAVRGREREEFDQLGASPMAPRRGRDGPAVHLDLEGAQELHGAGSAHGYRDDSAERWTEERSGNNAFANSRQKPLARRRTEVEKEV